MNKQEILDALNADTAATEIERQNDIYARAQLPQYYDALVQAAARGRFFALGDDLTGAQNALNEIAGLKRSIAILEGMVKKNV